VCQVGLVHRPRAGLSCSADLSASWCSAQGLCCVCWWCLKVCCMLLHKSRRWLLPGRYLTTRQLYGKMLACIKLIQQHVVSHECSWPANPHSKLHESTSNSHGLNTLLADSTSRAVCQAKRKAPLPDPTSRAESKHKTRTHRTVHEHKAR
jgi:hypothetical protein